MADEFALWERRPLEIGRVLNRAFALTMDRWPIVLGIAFLLVVLPTRLFYYTTAAFGFSSAELTSDPWLLAYWLPATATLDAVLRTIAEGALIGAAVAHHQRRPIGFWGSVRPAMNQLLPLAVIGLLYMLAVLVGTLALIVPGIMIAVMWSVVGSAAVNERLGILQAFGRSQDLTRGTRWRIFGLQLVLTIATSVLTSLTERIVAPLIGVSGESSFYTTNPLVIVLTASVGTVAAGFLIAAQCVLYLELAERSDGPMSDRLTEIFR